MKANSSEFEVVQVDYQPSVNQICSFVANNSKVLAMTSYKVGDINSHNQDAIHKQIWEFFRAFAEYYQSTLSRTHRRKKIEYQHSHGFPVGIMPNNTKIISVNELTLNDGHYLHFIWIDEEN